MSIKCEQFGIHQNAIQDGATISAAATSSSHSCTLREGASEGFSGKCNRMVVILAEQ